MSQSTRGTCIGKTTHPTSKATPSCFASASPSSSSKPRLSPFLLENGSALGLAQTINLPRCLITSSGRAAAEDATAVAATTVAANMRMKGPGRHLQIVTACSPA